VSLAIMAAVFPVVFLGELPDKSTFASLVLSTRSRPRSVWLGATAAFAVHVAIATTVGVALFRILPHRVVGVSVAVLFLAGAVFAFCEALRDGHDTHPDTAPARPDGRRRTVAAAFVVIFLAEWGDLTQILTVSLAARYQAPLSVGPAALLALAAVAGIAVLGGRGVLRFVNVVTVRYITAAVLLGLAVYTGWTAVG
jgi:Ca2+/H+ antiporter, TMEM165/GDT1 family